MSGGSMQYLYQRVRDTEFALDTPLRRAFARHLRLVAEALHDIEWVDSGDTSPGDEDRAIRACLGDAGALAAMIELAEESIEVLRAEIAQAKAQR